MALRVDCLEVAQASLDTVSEDARPDNLRRSRPKCVTERDLLAGAESCVFVSRPETARAYVHQLAANLNRLRVFNEEHDFAFGCTPVLLPSVERLARGAVSTP